MQLDPKDLLYIAGIISSIIISVLAALAQFRRIPSENMSNDASAAKSYAEAAEKVGEDNKILRQEIEALRVETSKQIKELRLELDKRDQVILELKREKDDLKDWAERLVYQLKSHRLDPVPFRSSIAPSKDA